MNGGRGDFPSAVFFVCLFIRPAARPRIRSSASIPGDDGRL
ncbi:MAG: hypothetical protein NZM00_10690 [Anaerolinea sp.]|nr:hypothetical protein [Anaerolinea sp.]